MQILSIDDDEFILEILSESILALGYPQALLATNGSDALRLLEDRTSNIDCVLLDIQMPDMSGVEVCTALRKLPHHHTTPVIMLTAMAEQDYVNRAFEVGATDYLTKPFELLELKARIGIAERQVEKTKLEEHSFINPSTSIEQKFPPQKFAISEPFAVRDIPGCISFEAFGNYVQQLQRGAYYSLAITAIKVSNFTELYERCEPQDFINLVVDIAEAISDNAPGQIRLFSYCGNGIFLCASDHHDHVIQEEFHFYVVNTIAEMGLFTASGLPLDVGLTQGESIRPGVFSKAGSTSILTKAIENAEHIVVQERETRRFRFG